MGFVASQAGEWLYESISFLSPIGLSGIILLILTLLILSGIEMASASQYIISLLVVMSLLLTSMICFANFDSDLLSPFMPEQPSKMFLIMPKLLFAFLGLLIR